MFVFSMREKRYSYLKQWKHFKESNCKKNKTKQDKTASREGQTVSRAVFVPPREEKPTETSLMYFFITCLVYIACNLICLLKLTKFFRSIKFSEITSRGSSKIQKNLCVLAGSPTLIKYCRICMNYRRRLQKISVPHV